MDIGPARTYHKVNRASMARKPPRWTKPAKHTGILVFDLCNNLEQVKPLKPSKDTDHIALQLLVNMNILLCDHDWAKSWIGFLHSLTSNMHISLIQDLLKAGRMLKHLNVHAGALGIDWLVCKYGIGRGSTMIGRESIMYGSKCSAYCTHLRA